MPYTEMDFKKIAYSIERDPFSWKGVSFFYLKLYSGASVRALESVIAKTIASNPDMLAFKGKNDDYILLGMKSEELDCLSKDAQAYFKVADVGAQWQEVCGVINTVAAPAGKDREGTAQKTGDHSHSILIVEDEPMTSQLMSHQLKKFGTVTATSNSREATANYMVHHPDLVFLDVHYHNDKADGFDVLKSIISADREAFIVMVSGDRSLAKVLQALQLGAQGFVAKPLQATDFPYYLAKFGRAQKKP